MPRRRWSIPLGDGTRSSTLLYPQKLPLCTTRPPPHPRPLLVFCFYRISGEICRVQYRNGIQDPPGKACWSRRGGILILLFSAPLSTFVLKASQHRHAKRFTVIVKRILRTFSVFFNVFLFDFFAVRECFVGVFSLTNSSIKQWAPGRCVRPPRRRLHPNCASMASLCNVCTGRCASVAIHTPLAGCMLETLLRRRFHLKTHYSATRATSVSRAAYKSRFRRDYRHTQVRLGFLKQQNR